MDGLVSNVGLIAGVGGSGVSPNTIVVTGFAGLVAGAISMALGEYTSVRTQTEQVAAEVAKERRELERNPRLRPTSWPTCGWPGACPKISRTRSPRSSTPTPTRRCGCTPRRSSASTPTSSPSPWTAAISSFLCFAVGALIPLLPYLFGSDQLWPALLAGGLGLFAAGALVARFTRKAWWLSGLRQFLLGAAAAAATYLIGTLIGGAAGIAGASRQILDRAVDRAARRASSLAWAVSRSPSS
jgi:VIT1/CCC1 family predicted Fe2+/Mn2+ transporter